MTTARQLNLALGQELQATRRLARSLRAQGATLCADGAADIGPPTIPATPDPVPGKRRQVA